MSNNANMQIQIPGVDFSQMAREAIALKLTEALVGADDIIQKIVVSAMTHKVDDKGQTSQYASYNTTPFVEWLAQDLIRKATLEVLAKRVESMRPMIEKAVEAELKRSTKAAAKALTGAFVERAGSSYGLTCDIALKISDRS